jgi:hypothetical protein
LFLASLPPGFPQNPNVLLIRTHPNPFPSVGYRFIKAGEQVEPLLYLIFREGYLYSRSVSFASARASVVSLHGSRAGLQGRAFKVKV